MPETVHTPVPVRMKIKDALRIMKDRKQLSPSARRLKIITEIIEIEDGEQIPAGELITYLATPVSKRAGRWTKHICPKCGVQFKQYSYNDKPGEKLCRGCRLY